MTETITPIMFDPQNPAHRVGALAAITAMQEAMGASDYCYGITDEIWTLLGLEGADTVEEVE